MTDASYLTGRLLLAMPGMFDPRFERSVNFMCVHNEDGALGIGVGQVREGITFHEVLNELDIDPGIAPDCEVLHGGPVEPGKGFLLHSRDWMGPDSLKVCAFAALSSSIRLLRDIAAGKGPKHWLIALGYAGWGAGQLEGEMRQHGWYAANGHPEILFETPVRDRWTECWRADGIDPALLANVTGSA